MTTDAFPFTVTVDCGITVTAVPPSGKVIFETYAEMVILANYPRVIWCDKMFSVGQWIIDSNSYRNNTIDFRFTTKEHAFLFALHWL